jgi:2'-5' RNA ligase
VALDLAERDRTALAAWRDELVAGRDDLRPVAEAALHVTLAFLGYRPEKEIASIAAAVGAAAAPVRAPRLAPAEVVARPRKRPRVFALDLHDEGDACAALQQVVSDALAAARLYTPEKRPFRPHVTLARVKRDRRARSPGAPAPAATPTPAPDAPRLPSDPPPLAPFAAAQVTLYRSTLRPQGALYEPLATITLSG